ncbi:brevican core protein [Lingula anatina]|uniref:Brevican core protein n=1 Tax=Lingula anatina TaxID=7574 RepID=A0A1S3K177_LINAN|nr:brevican core protein [Lingula anatina]|eukprot:XP_013416388.1 brevican core protein [Lingula anatina]
MATKKFVAVLLADYALLMIWFGASNSSSLLFRVQPQTKFIEDLILQTTSSMSKGHCALHCLGHRSCLGAYYCGNTKTCALTNFNCSGVQTEFLVSDPNCSYIEARNRSACLECGCKNGGTCIQLTEGSGKCACPVPYGGLNCERNLRCPTQFEVTFRTSCYSFNMTLKGNFYQAKAHCESMGARLVAVDDEEEHTFIRQYIMTDEARSATSWFTATTDEASEGTWVLSGWGDIPAPFTAWGPGEPNNNRGNQDCVQYYKVTKLFDDIQCSDSINFICETEET